MPKEYKALWVGGDTHKEYKILSAELNMTLDQAALTLVQFYRANHD